MMHHLSPIALFALLVLSACQTALWDPLPQDDSPQGRRCREEALADPEVRGLARATTFGVNPTHDARVAEERAAALQRAWNACMLRHGATPAGGVERPRRPRL